MGHSYRVMDAEKRPLFTVRGNVGQNVRGNLLGSLAGGSDSYLGRMAARSVDMSYLLTDPEGQPRGQIAKSGGANESVFTLSDPTGRELVRVNLKRSLIGGVSATAVAPDGRPLFGTSGNLLRHNFAIQDGSGAVVARVHEAWVAVRDTYRLDLEQDVDPLLPLVFAVVIDFEKEK